MGCILVFRNHSTPPFSTLDSSLASKCFGHQRKRTPNSDLYCIDEVLSAMQEIRTPKCSILSLIFWVSPTAVHSAFSFTNGHSFKTACLTTTMARICTFCILVAAAMNIAQAFLCTKICGTHRIGFGDTHTHARSRWTAKKSHISCSIEELPVVAAPKPEGSKGSVLIAGHKI